MNNLQKAMKSVPDEEIIQAVADELSAIDWTGGKARMNSRKQGEQAGPDVTELVENLREKRERLVAKIADATAALQAVNVALIELGEPSPTA